MTTYTSAGHELSMFNNKPVLPPLEAVAKQVHQAWIEAKLAQGITSRPASCGTEQMVDYDLLPDHLQELDRATVRAVYAAIISTRKT